MVVQVPQKIALISFTLKRMRTLEVHSNTLFTYNLTSSKAEECLVFAVSLNSQGQEKILVINCHNITAVHKILTGVELNSMSKIIKLSLIESEG